MEKNSLGQQPSSWEEYGSLYKGIGRGDTWTLPENFAENPRAAIVAHTREKFPGPVSVLDIGSGKGINTKWIAEVDRNSHWTGVDVVSREELGLKIQKEDDDRFHFLQGNMLDESFRDQLAGSVGKFEMIVDQGAVLAEIEDETVRAQYLEFIANLLNEGGRFVTLVMEGDGKTVVFPDGRTRRTYSQEEFQSPVFRKNFDLEESNLYSYSYLPEGLGFPDIKNALGAKVGDVQQLTASQFVLRKSNNL